MIHYAVSHDIEKVLVNLFMAVKKDYPTLLVYQSKWKSELQFCKDCLTEMMGTQWFEARVFVIQSLKQKGLCRDSQNSKVRLGVCSRPNNVGETMVEPQWF